MLRKIEFLLHGTGRYPGHVDRCMVHVQMRTLRIFDLCEFAGSPNAILASFGHLEAVDVLEWYACPMLSRSMKARCDKTFTVP